MSSAGNKIPVRSLAADILDKMGQEYDKSNSGQLLSKYINLTDERQRLTDIVSGTIRSKITLDSIIEQISGKRIKKIQKKILNILRIGVYELIFNDKTPVYAIINESVESVKKRAGKKQKGFVNAVLRETERNIKNRNVNYTGTENPAIIPTGWDRGCEFKREILPDYDKNKIGYFSIGFSIPEFLLEKWMEQFDSETVSQICTAGNRRPNIYLRVNRLKISREDFINRLSTEGIETAPVGESDMVKVTSPADVTKIWGYDEGFFSVQDLTAYSVVQFIAPQEDTRILDFCAAPGTKACALAESLDDNAEIIATDIAPDRLKQVKSGIDRLALENIKTIDYKSFLSDDSQKRSFDYVLADVPCSNTGVLARRPEARYRISEISLREICEKQLEILRKASDFVKPGGAICYSTCSILKEENEQLVDKFLKENADFRESKRKLTLPCSSRDSDYDGGFVSLLKKG